ncbi:hypothetical protein N431DRAFT_471914 [Stipitochalara longipes BDJ]|nr:hypothetical protein N431DRAFT_471914 [Stipitochalara longipes BDJ]
MPDNWDLYKDVIEKLYIKQGCTLENLREKMRVDHGINAAPRTYKLKLDEWNFRKYKRNRKVRPRKTHAEATSARADLVPSLATSSPNTSSSSISGDLNTSGESSPISTLSSSQDRFEAFGITRHPFHAGTVSSGTSSTSDYDQISHTVYNSVPHVLVSVFHEYGPIVNSSLMFFASRTDSQNLYLLAKYTNMIPRAVEILLRNWKAGGEYMHYALRFLKDSSYCHTLLSVNWTRWTDQDETLFDLIEVYVPEEEQVALTQAVLKADLTFQHPLERLRAAWASTWRLALQKQEWRAAKDCLLRFRTLEGYHAHTVLNCALVVVAEELLRRNREILAGWRGQDELFPEQARGQYMEILKDCRDLQIPIDPTLQCSMRIEWVS